MHVRLLLLAVGITVVVPQNPPQAGAVTAGCGYVSEIPCPGCQPHVPTSGCVCQKNGASCDCSKNAGGVQGDLLIQCDTARWHVVENPDGFRIGEGPEARCSKWQRCMTAWGTQLGCGEYDPVTQKCTIPAIPPCSWRDEGSSFAPTRVQGDPCRPQE